MNREALDLLDRYLMLRSEIDKRCSEITEKAGPENITCREGCCSCCTSITVLPVEYYSIMREQEKTGTGEAAAPPAPAPAPSASGRAEESAAPCAFLKHSRCMIYTSRPLICRTQGLPLLYSSDEGDSYSIALCEKNFKDQDNDYEFETAGCLDLDSLNSRLYSLNLKFIRLMESYTGSGTERYAPYHRSDRIELNNLNAEAEPERT